MLNVGQIQGGQFMTVQYNKLFKLLIDRKIKPSELRERAGISRNIISRMNNDEFISMESIAKICTVLDCGVDDILEFIPADKEGT
jgi:putative transcriptional regulator